MAWMSAALLIIQALPTLISTVQGLFNAIEKDAPAQSGQQKKAIVMDMVEAGLDAANNVSGDSAITAGEKNALIDVADRAVDSYVTFKNETGGFHKSPVVE